MTMARQSDTHDGNHGDDGNDGNDGPYLLPPLPDGPFVCEPEEIERLEVSLLPDGTLFARGTRARLEAFTQACAEEGVQLIVDHAAMCG